MVGIDGAQLIRDVSLIDVLPVISGGQQLLHFTDYTATYCKILPLRVHIVTKFDQIAWVEATTVHRLLPRKCS